MAELIAREVLPPTPQGTLSKGQLFPAEFVATEGFYRSQMSVHAISALDATWVTIDSGVWTKEYSKVGDGQQAGQETVEALRRVFPQNHRGWLRHEVGLDAQIGVPGLERVADLTKELEGIEEGLSPLLDSVGIEGHELNGSDLRRTVLETRETGYADSVAKLNEGIAAYPGGVLLGVAVGMGGNSDATPKAAKLEGVYIGKNPDRERTVLPVVSGEDEELHKLSRARDIAVYGVFVKATETGIKQAEEQERKRQENIRRHSK